MPERYEFCRVEHELVRRVIRVASIRDLTPRMRRFEFESDELKGFTSPTFDNNIKIFFPALAEEGKGRSFTPRYFDPEAGRLTIDVAMHRTGTAVEWAGSVGVGDEVEIGGPKASMMIPDDFDWILMIGDETAIPAIGRRLESLDTGVPITTIITVADDDEHQEIETAADWNAVWINRGEPQPSDEQVIRAAIDALTLPEGAGFVWIACESGVMNQVKRYLIDKVGHPEAWIRSSGYWKR